MNKTELKYITIAGIASFVWFIFLMPKLTAYFDGNNPFLQFLIFNMMLYAFFFIFLKIITTNLTFSLKSSFGLTSLFLALDILLPEYHVSISGELVKGAVLGVSTSDYIVGLFGQTYLNLSGILLYGFTYLIAPIVLLIISAYILPNFVRRL